MVVGWNDSEQRLGIGLTGSDLDRLNNHWSGTALRVARETFDLPYDVTVIAAPHRERLDRVFLAAQRGGAKIIWNDGLRLMRACFDGRDTLAVGLIRSDVLLFRRQTMQMALDVVHLPQLAFNVSLLSGGDRDDLGALMREQQYHGHRPLTALASA